MSGNLSKVDWGKVPPPSDDFELIPAGEYDAIITGSVDKPTKRGDGSYLELTIQILDGKFKNRLIWDRLNIDNPSETAVEIATGTLESIASALGLSKPEDSSEFHDKPLTIVVNHEKRNDTGEMTARVKRYKALATGEKKKNLEGVKRHPETPQITETEEVPF